MGLLDRLKKAFGAKNDVKSIQSMDNRVESIQEPPKQPEQKPEIKQSEPTLSYNREEIDTNQFRMTPMPDRISNYREELPPSEPRQLAVPASTSRYIESQPEQSAPPIQKDSYELGLAAGYTGRSIKEIEASLTRIESQMVTKDWFTVQLDKLDRRVEDIERAMGIIKGAIPAMEQQKRAIVPKMPLTKRMEDLLSVVREAGEISFADLAIKMGMDISDLRSLLSIMTKRTNLIERYRVHRAGWIRYAGDDSSSTAAVSTSESI